MSLPATDLEPSVTRAFKPRTAPATAPSDQTGPGSGAPHDNLPATSMAIVTVADLRRGDLAGRRIGSYELGVRIGQGGMGQVFTARHLSLGKTFAIKFLSGDCVFNAEAERRFQNEVTSLGKLQHPNILSAVDAGCSSDVHYLVTEYVEGQDLGELVRLKGPIDYEQAIGLIRQAAAGLSCAHQLGFVHRDIKPSNLILDQHGTLRLLDFGLVRHEQKRDDGATMAGQLLGTADFLAPEQAADGRIADPRSDLYSLGCTFLFLLSGKPPFNGEQFAGIASKIHAHLFLTPPALEDGQLNIPENLHACLSRLVAKDPCQRFQTADELSDCLDRLVGDSTSGARRSRQATTETVLSIPSSRGSSPSSGLRQKWIRAGCVVGIVLLLSVAGQRISTRQAQRVAEKSATAAPAISPSEIESSEFASSSATLPESGSSAESRPAPDAEKPSPPGVAATSVISPSGVSSVTEIPDSDDKSESGTENLADDSQEPVTAEFLRAGSSGAEFGSGLRRIGAGRTTNRPLNQIRSQQRQ